jgi:type I restriction enzyme M protein
VKFEDFEPVLAWWEHRNQNENAWSVPLSEIIKNNYNLDRKNPNLAELRDLREPEEVIKSFIETELKILNTLKEIQIEITDGENTTKF